MSGAHTTQEVIGDVVATVESLRKRTQLPRQRLLAWVGIHDSRYRRWRTSATTSRITEHKRRCSWEILPEERDAIVEYHDAVKREGRHLSHRFLTYEMLDNDIAACSDSTTYRVLYDAGRIHPRLVIESKKGTGFDQPTKIHEHWHIDISYLWEFGHRAYLISVLEGKSRVSIRASASFLAERMLVGSHHTTTGGAYEEVRRDVSRS